MTDTIDRIFAALEQLIPVYMENPLDSSKANGNVAVCIIDEEGRVYGKIFGDYKPKGRETFGIAWTKASQVWLTGIKTREYERMIFTNEIPEGSHGIRTPELIGWEGGQPLTLADGRKLSVGFSGFRGIVDIEIMLKALEEIQK
ncbi:GlcG/HbpS family heme-binding protein [Flavihumibacter fluvii]|uniref:GlcG/HbpS family heme-binding protein n=1 Tax=Flavihumibacter fluvii TaxID=2838157 RepID=UPI001EFAB3A6|nr:hypothetical protein [Flavihumibacter fluvii]ULQ53329.1 hypothetical protein KJS93_03235 [Flavihumibacter fluvii]